MNSLRLLKKITKTSCLLLLYVLVFGHTAVAEADDKKTFNNEYWSLQLENDFFASSGDRYYTHGTLVSLLLMEEPPGWLKRVARLFPAYQSDRIINGVNYTIGQKIFTPNNTTSTIFAENDRPYAGYLYTSAALLSRVGKNSLFKTGNLLEFTIGLIGPMAVGKEVQTSFHDLIGIDSPQGWNNQLANEIGLGFSYSRFWKRIQPVLDSFEVGVTPQLTAAVGNIYTYVAAGIMFRMGTLLDNDLSPPNIKPGFPGIPLFIVAEQHSWYFYVGAETRIVGRNIFLDGNTFQESHSVEKESIVGDFQFGFVYRVGNLRLSLSNMYRTKEHKTQKDNTHYGTINISIAM